MAQTWVELTLILTRAVGSYSSGPTDDGTLKSRSTIPRSKMIHPVLNISYIAGLKDHCGLQMASEVTVDLSKLGVLGGPQVLPGVCQVVLWHKKNVWLCWSHKINKSLRF